MKRVIFAMLALLLAGAGATFFAQQAQELGLKVSDEKPVAGEPVVVSLVGPGDASPDLRNLKPVWTFDGEGQFVTDVVGVDKVRFLPAKAGSAVTILCAVSTPTGQRHLSVILNVGGRPAETAAIPPAGAAHEDKPTPKPTAHPAQVTGDLAVDDMEYMVPSGYEGDAAKENGGAVKLKNGNTVGCYRETSCIRIEYRPEDGKLGWAAVAWQRVTDGGFNFGQSPGADYSQGGYLSLRVFAAGLPNASGQLPTVQFQSGGNVDAKYSANNRATYFVKSRPVPLTREWHDYCLSLENKDLSNTVSPFTVILPGDSNPSGGAAVLLENARFSHDECKRTRN